MTGSAKSGAGFAFVPGFRCAPSGLRSARERGGAFAERALHHHGVEPAAEFEADVGMGPDHLKSGPGMDADRSGVGGIADHRDHLAIASRFGFGDQPLQQLQADPAPMDCGLKVNRILHREAIGRPRPVRSRIGVSDHAAFETGDQIGESRRPSPRQSAA